MSKYIDADKFLKYADEPSIYDTTDLKDMINEQPTAEVRPIVYGRCKGCEYCNNHRPLLALYTEYSIEVDDRELSVWQGLKCEGTVKISFCPVCGRKFGGKQ